MNHVFTWLYPASVVILLEILFAYPRSIFWIAPALILGIIFSVFSITNRKIDKMFFKHALSPIVYTVSGLLFVSIQEGFVLKHVAVFVIAIFLLVYLENMYVLWNDKEKHQRYSMLNISSYFNIFAVFMLTSALYWLVFFLAFSSYTMLIILSISIFFLTFQTLVIAEFPLKKSLLFSSVITFICGEIFIAEFSLPTSVYLNGAFLSMCYYFLVGITKNRLLNTLKPKIILRYSLVFLICSLFMVITAKLA